MTKLSTLSTVSPSIRCMMSDDTSMLLDDVLAPDPIPDSGHDGSLRGLAAFGIQVIPVNRFTHDIRRPSLVSLARTTHRDTETHEKIVAILADVHAHDERPNSSPVQPVLPSLDECKESDVRLVLGMMRIAQPLEFDRQLSK
jgi:hypothetical protein